MIFWNGQRGDILGDVQRSNLLVEYQQSKAFIIWKSILKVKPSVCWKFWTDRGQLPNRNRQIEKDPWEIGSSDQCPFRQVGRLTANKRCQRVLQLCEILRALNTLGKPKTSYGSLLGRKMGKSRDKRINWHRESPDTFTWTNRGSREAQQVWRKIEGSPV